MARYDLFTGQTIKFTCLYLLAIQTPTLLTLEALANLPMESNPAGSSDIAEFAGQAPADGIPIALGVSSPDSERKIKINQAMVAQTGGLISPKDSNLNRKQNSGNVQSKKAGFTTQPAEPIFNDRKLLEQKLKLLQLIDQLGFDEAISAFQDQMKLDAQRNFESGLQPANPASSKPTIPRNRHPKIQAVVTEPSPTLPINSTPLSQVNENQQVPQMEAANLEKYSGINGTLEQTVSMTMPRNRNPNPTNLAAPPHHQTNVYIQQTKFHNNHQDISDKSSTQNEQVIVASPVLTAQYVDDDKDDDYDGDNDKGVDMYDDDQRKPTEEQFREAINRIGMSTLKPFTTQRKTTMFPKRTTTTRKVIPTRKLTARPTTQSTTEKLPFDLLAPDPEVNGTTEVVVPCPTFLEFVVDAQVFWESLRKSSGIINSFELVVQAIVQSMKTLGRCFYRVSSDVIKVILDFFGVKEAVENVSSSNIKRDVNKVKISHR